jgi:tRNA (uracil-5-)-methyltransferase
VETLRLDDGDAFAYKHAEGAFSNPNAWMAEHTLTWLRSCARAIASERRGAGAAGASLLELYCGCGNHTVALAGLFTRVVAVEISEELCDAARDNLRRNGIEEGVSVVHAPSASVSRELLRGGGGGGGGLGLDGLDGFDVVLVDPPRAGLDPDTLALVRRFEYVLYVSCDPASLARDAMGAGEGQRKGNAPGALSNTHDVVKFAVFDHFPYTRHAEVGACFARRRPDGRSRRRL